MNILIGMFKSSYRSVLPREFSLHAFTMLELLVVIVVSGLLACMILPALGSARDDDYSVKCINNLKELGQATAIYLNDFDGMIWHAEGEAPVYFWGRQLIRKNHAPGTASQGNPVFWCPAYKSELDRIRREGTHSTMWPNTTYALNLTNARRPDIPSPGVIPGSPSAAGRGGPEAVYWPEAGWGNHYAVNSRVMANPSNYWLFTEAVRAETDDSVSVLRHDQGRPGDHLWDAKARNGTGIHLRHGEAANMSFFDGHVESTDPGRLLTVGPIEFRQGWTGRYELKEF